MLSVKEFMVSKNIRVFEHTPYYRDLAARNLVLLPKIKSALKRDHFSTAAEIQTETVVPRRHHLVAIGGA